MEAKHTHGPWVLEDYMGPDIGFYKMIGADEIFIPIASIHCPDIYTTSDSEVQEAANSALIQAAPDLLEALKTAQVRIFMLEGNSPEYIKAGTAIAKAEGR